MPKDQEISFLPPLGGIPNKLRFVRVYAEGSTPVKIKFYGNGEVSARFVAAVRDEIYLALNDLISVIEDEERNA